LRHLAVVSQRRPSEHFTWARKAKRNFIMHVGPTNSGKTHHALRALAAARSGVYAGPLRLLAYEIWERLNLGQIVPLGVHVPSPSSDPPPPTFITDKLIAPQAKINSNLAYARLTNMVTGEERKIVDEDASLLTCTIEMLSFRHQYDVGVIDEIQMIGDPERGFAWTDAVLGLCAKEIHLCGEESAVPVVRQLLQETGDSLTVKRYERLTPLSVEEQSLHGDLSKVLKGDCVVSFARSRIFEIKRKIEETSGLRCAVVYGKLPPEIRSEQAALFNDPNSGFDVIIGSDAIGMGLNLYVSFLNVHTHTYIYISSVDVDLIFQENPTYHIRLGLQTESGARPKATLRFPNQTDCRSSGSLRSFAHRRKARRLRDDVEAGGSASGTRSAFASFYPHVDACLYRTYL